MMKRNRFDTWVDIICLVQLVGIVVYLIVGWNSFPEQIPGHFAADGTATRYGGRGSLLVTPIFGGVLYGAMFLPGRFPEFWNTGAKVTEENKKRIIPALKNLINVLKLMIVTKFTFITIFQSLGTSLPSWFLPVFLLGFFVPIAVCIVNLIRVSKSGEGKDL